MGFGGEHTHELFTFHEAHFQHEDNLAWLLRILAKVVPCRSYASAIVGFVC